MLRYVYVQLVKYWDGSFGKPGLENVTGIYHQEIYASLRSAWQTHGETFCACGCSLSRLISSRRTSSLMWPLIIC